MTRKNDERRVFYLQDHLVPSIETLEDILMVEAMLYTLRTDPELSVDELVDVCQDLYYNVPSIDHLSAYQLIQILEQQRPLL